VDQLPLMTGKSTARKFHLIHVAPRGTTVGLTRSLSRSECKMDVWINVGLVDQTQNIKINFSTRCQEWRLSEQSNWDSLRQLELFDYWNIIICMLKNTFCYFFLLRWPQSSPTKTFFLSLREKLKFASLPLPNNTSLYILYATRLCELNSLYL